MVIIINFFGPRPHYNILTYLHIMYLYTEYAKHGRHCSINRNDAIIL